MNLYLHLFIFFGVYLCKRYPKGRDSGSDLELAGLSSTLIFSKKTYLHIFINYSHETKIKINNVGHDRDQTLKIHKMSLTHA